MKKLLIIIIVVIAIMLILSNGITASPLLDGTVNVEVSASNDDASELDDNTGFTNNSGSIRTASDTVSSERWNGGIFFSGINIPQGSIIDVAYITLKDQGNSFDTRQMNIYAEDVDNAVDFGTNADVTDRTNTSAFVEYIDVNPSCQTCNSPSIVSVIQEIVDRPGWSSGNNIVILLRGLNAAQIEFTQLVSFDDADDFNSSIHIEWSDAATPTPTPTMAATPTPTMAATIDIIPIGSVIMWSSSDLPPSNYYTADGSCLDNASYPEIATVLSDTFGDCGGDSSKTQLPNFNGKFPIGNIELAPPSGFPIGTTGGEYEHTLDISEMPVHSHDYLIPDSGPSPYALVSSGSIGLNRVVATVEPQGSSAPHNNTPPYLSIGYIIKVAPDNELAGATVPITSIYNIGIEFSDNASVNVTKTLITSDVENYTGTIRLPKFYSNFDTVYTIAMFMVFALVGAAAGKPTMFIIAFIGLYITGVLQNGGVYVTYPIIILSASFFIYKFIIMRRKT